MRKLSKELLYKSVLGEIERDLSESVIGGASVMVSQGGEILLSEMRGYSNIETKEPLRQDSIFRLASMTKPVTGVAALIAFERGWFSPEDKITDYFPEFADMYVGRLEGKYIVPDHKPKEELLVKHFLSNVSGFMGSSPIYPRMEFPIPPSAYADNKTMVDYCLKNTCFTYEPCRAYGYCGYQAYDVIALLIERFSGKKYADFIRDEIFTPLGIKDITFNPTDEQWERVVTMSDKAVGGRFNVDMGRHTFERFPLTYTSAGAGLVSSIVDYHKFASMLLSGGSLDGVRIVSPESIKLMSTPIVPLDFMGEGATGSWGLGVYCRVENNTLPAGTFGWSGAYGTHFWVDPENEIVAIYMKASRWHDSHGAGETGRAFEAAVMSSFE